MNTVYFLGAGCSKNFGYPLTGEIMPEILQNLYKHDLFQIGSRKTSRERTYETQLRKFLEKLYPGLRPDKLGYPSQTGPNITEVLSLVDHFCFYNVPPHPEIANEVLLRFRDLINRAVVELILDYDLRIMTKDEEDLFDKFVRPLRQKKAGHKISIITTNYDLLIDWEFDDLCRGNKIDYGIDYRDVYTSEMIFQNPRPHFHYYKLHGSLNWLRCDLCGQYYINADGSIAAQAYEDKLGDYNTCQCSSKLRLKSVLVTPSIVRDIRDPNLLQIWKSALEAIRTADSIIFVGYSLPPEDLAIKSIIMRALNGRVPGKKLKVEVVQKGNAAETNFRNIFGEDMKYYSSGLEEYFFQNEKRRRKTKKISKKLLP